MATKMAVAFANIFMANIEKEIFRQSTYKPLVWKRFIDDVFWLWSITKEKWNMFHPTIKFAAEISENGITFLDTNV